MLGGSSNANYMAYVRGHPGDYDNWASRGASGWSYEDVLPYFKKSEGFVTSPDLVVDEVAHSTSGELGVCCRSPVLPPAQAFVDAAVKVGFPKMDYNGCSRGGPNGCVSLHQHTARKGKRSDTYTAFLKEQQTSRNNLKIVTEAHATKILFTGTRATSVEYLCKGSKAALSATKEIILCAGAIGSPQLLLLSGVGPKAELQKYDIPLIVDSSQVGKNLTDHLLAFFLYNAPKIGMAMGDVVPSMGPDALRALGVLPANEADDTEQHKAIVSASNQLVADWDSSGVGVASSTFIDASIFYNTGAGDSYTHDAQICLISAGFNGDIWRDWLYVDVDTYFGSAEKVNAAFNPEEERFIILPGIVTPHSRGSLTLASKDPMVAPLIDFNYYGNPHDLEVMVKVMRRTLEISQAMGLPPSALYVPQDLAKKHSYDGQKISDDLLRDWAIYYSHTYYHPMSTCAIGAVVDHQLKVIGASGLRVADASVIPMPISGNTNAPTIMIGEKCAEMVATEHGVSLSRWAANDNASKCACVML